MSSESLTIPVSINALGQSSTARRGRHLVDDYIRDVSTVLLRGDYLLNLNKHGAFCAK